MRRDQRSVIGLNTTMEAVMANAKYNVSTESTVKNNAYQTMNQPEVSA